MEMQWSSGFLFKRGHASPGSRTSETPAGEPRQIAENVREGSRKEERASGAGKQDVPGSRGGSFFSTLKSYISLPLTAAGFLVASSPQQAASVPKDCTHDCLSEKLYDDCTGQMLGPGKVDRYWQFQNGSREAIWSQNGTAADGDWSSI